jgi:hypothetical protein
VSLPATLALIDAMLGLYLAWYAVRRQRENRDLLMLVALVLLGCAVALAVLALPDERPGTLPPAPGQLV